MTIPWKQPVQLNDVDRGGILNLSLEEAIATAATYEPARLALAQILCEPAIDTKDGPRNVLNADQIALLIQQR